MQAAKKDVRLFTCKGCGSSLKGEYQRKEHVCNNTYVVDRGEALKRQRAEKRFGR